MASLFAPVQDHRLDPSPVLVRMGTFNHCGRHLHPARRARSRHVTRRASQALTIAFLAGFLLAPSPASAQQGIIEVADPRHNFGLMQEGDVARHVFTIANTGEIPFSLTGVQPSCECVLPEWSFDSLEPGEEGEITVQFNSEGHRGTFEHRVSIESTAAPSHLDLFLEGRVVPRSLARGDTLGLLVFGGFRRTLPVVKPGDPLSHPILIKNIADEPIEITEVRTDTHYVSVEVSSNVITPGDFIEISVDFRTSEMRRGPFGHRIDLVTTDSAIPVKRIRLTGLLQ